MTASLLNHRLYPIRQKMILLFPDNPLVRALLAGAVSYAQDLIQQTFNEELAQHRVPAQDTVAAGGYRQPQGEQQ